MRSEQLFCDEIRRTDLYFQWNSDIIKLNISLNRSPNERMDERVNEMSARKSKNKEQKKKQTATQKLSQLNIYISYVHGRGRLDDDVIRRRLFFAHVKLFST